MPPRFEQGNSLWKDARRRLLRNRAAMASLVFLLLMVVACFLLPLFPCIANPNATNLANIPNNMARASIPTMFPRTNHKSMVGRYTLVR